MEPKTEENVEQELENATFGTSVSLLRGVCELADEVDGLGARRPQDAPAASKKQKAMCLTCPHNPTGTMMNEATFQRVVELAEERGVPPYVVFSDATLREMVRLRPSTREEFLGVKGVGEWKCEEFGARFLAAIAAARIP